MRSDERRTFTENARRAQIVACAIEVVAELGYVQTSIRKIADRVGVAMSVVLYHFENKDELVRAMMTDIFESVIIAVVPAIEAEPTATGKLRSYIRANAAFIESHRQPFMAMLDIGLNFRSANGKRLDELKIDPRLHEGLAKLDLQAIFRLGQDSGEFRPLETRPMAVALRSALNGAVLEIARDSEFDVRGYGEELVTVFELATRGT